MLGNGKNKTYRVRDITCKRMGSFFTIFAHATRMRIFCTLENGPKTVGRIAEEAEISNSNASQHLRLMRDRGAVVAERQGQSIYYRMADPRFFEAANLIREALAEQAEDRTHEVDYPVARRLAGAAQTDKKFLTGNHNQTTTN
ncbi:MAG: ArsR/SmtB family transcription factor [Acidobacteriaceae bacterium]